MTPQETSALKSTPRHLLVRFLGPALNLKEMNLICWGLFVAFLVLPVCVVVVRQAKTGQLAQTFVEVDFVYFYGMGRIFNEYPADEVYDYELQKRAFTEVHPLKAGIYNPVPYAPFIGVLFRPLAHLSYFRAFLLWSAVSFSLYIAGVAFLTARFFPHDPLRRSLIFCFALCFYPFIGWTMTTGHLSTIGFFSLAWAFREDDLEHPFRSGLALSIALYKPTLVVLLLPMLVVTKRFRTLFGVAAGGSILALFSTVAEGVRVWPGYINALLSYGRGSAGVDAHPFKQAWKYVDLSSFASLIPGGRTWQGQMVLLGCACWAAFSLAQIWWRSAGSRRPASTLVWATTLTWTLILNVYVPIYDSILIVLSAVATAGVLKDVSERYYKWFTVLWVLILGSSWITVRVADATGIQIVTLLFAVLGVLQLAATRKALHPGASGPVHGKEAQVGVVG